MQHVRKKRADVHRPTRVEDPEPVKARSRERLKADLDDLLADVDEALALSDVEVDQFVQKGGQ